MVKEKKNMRKLFKEEKRCKWITRKSLEGETQRVKLSIFEGSEKREILG